MDASLFGNTSPSGVVRQLWNCTEDQSCASWWRREEGRGPTSLPRTTTRQDTKVQQQSRRRGAWGLRRSLGRGIRLTSCPIDFCLWDDISKRVAAGAPAGTESVDIQSSPKAHRFEDTTIPSPFCRGSHALTCSKDLRAGGQGHPSRLSKAFG